MRILIRFAALALGLLPALAAAQVPTTLPPNTVLGRLGISPGPAQAIPFSTLSSNISSAQTANTVNAGPPSGGATTPAFRALVAADLPALATNQVTRSNLAQGVARSVIGVTGNATANVADIQLGASQVLGTTAANNSLAGVAYGPGLTAAAGQLLGEPSTGSASAGNVGEYIESVITSGAPTSLVTATAKTMTSISLTAGDWDVDCAVAFSTGTTTSVTQVAASISLVTNTVDLTAGRFSALTYAAFVPGLLSAAWGLNVQPVRMSFSTTTSVFLIALSTFTVSTMNSYGIIRARRVR